MTFSNTSGTVPYNDMFFSGHRGLTKSIIQTKTLYCKQLQNEFHALIFLSRIDSINKM